MYDEDLDDAERAERTAKRDEAAGRHARNMAAVDALLGLEGEAATARWRVIPVPMVVGDDEAELHRTWVPAGRAETVVAGRWDTDDATLVAALRNGAREALQARRRVLERHAPNLDNLAAVIDCSHCIDGQENPYAFPCDDYTDAEAGLVMPHRVMLLPDPGGRRVEITCPCCGWSRLFNYARLTGASVAARLAEIWGRRHLEGDPAAQLGADDAPAG